MRTAGIIILIVGLVMTVYTGFNYVTRENVVEIGSLHISAEHEHEVNWEPYAGLAVMIIGGGVIFLSRKKVLAS